MGVVRFHASQAMRRCSTHLTLERKGRGSASESESFVWSYRSGGMKKTLIKYAECGTILKVIRDGVTVIENNLTINGTSPRCPKCGSRKEVREDSDDGS